MTHLPMASASMEVVATTSLVLQFTKTCGMHTKSCSRLDFDVTQLIHLPIHGGGCCHTAGAAVHKDLWHGRRDLF